MAIRASVRTFVLVAALAATLAGCSNAPATGTTTTPTPGPTVTDPVAQITANWEAFFNPKTPNDQRVKLIQDGDVFAATIQAQSSNPLAATASVKVDKVTLTSATQAVVAYSILVGGQPALPNQNGLAVLDNGTWKVSASSFCNLLILENGGKATGLPAPCQSSGSTSPSPSAS
jgi:ABC-type transport system substrate-binding protein